MSGDRIIHEIRTMAASVDAKLDTPTANLDGLTAKIDSLRRMIIVLIAQISLLVVLGFLAFIGRADPGSDPCRHVESPQALVQSETSDAELLVPTGDPTKAFTDGHPD